MIKQTNYLLFTELSLFWQLPFPFYQQPSLPARQALLTHLLDTFQPIAYVSAPLFTAFLKGTDSHLNSKSSGLLSGLILFNLSFNISELVTHKPLSSLLLGLSECLLLDSTASLLGLSQPLTASSSTCSSPWEIPSSLLFAPFTCALHRECRSKLNRNERTRTQLLKQSK